MMTFRQFIIIWLNNINQRILLKRFEDFSSSLFVCEVFSYLGIMKITDEESEHVLVGKVNQRKNYSFKLTKFSIGQAN